MHNWGREDASLDLGRVGVDHKPVVLHVGVFLPVEETNALLNGCPALLGESDGKLDHVGGLNVRQLDVVALVGIDLQDVHRQTDVLAADLLGHLDDRQS